MKRTSCLSRTFFRRPAVRDLVPDLRLLLVVLTVGCESHVGVWVPGGLAEDSGLNQSALAGGLEDLEGRGHIASDKATGELFLTSFFRDNRFAGQPRHQQAAGDFDAISSEKLKERVLAAVAASPECGLFASFLGNPKENKDLRPKEKGKEKEKVF